MEQKQALAERLKQANNILVTVSSNPSVDQLAACIGMTLALNKLGKHATAVFSGEVPNIIEFLEPEKTIEKNTDSLRDFIIALDKSKADKLRYKVEDTVVKIFITPYKTSINEKDLEFSQGDFNVDVVLALGVHNQTDLDTAITSHGRILHDATVATVNVEPGGELGTVNWVDHDASSLSELAAELVDVVDKSVMDTQIATAFLTGIVAETERFSNDKTSPMTMTISAELMAAGANQQLVATKLEPPKPDAPVAEAQADKTPEQQDKGAQPVPPPKPDDGTLEISHVGEPAPEERKPEPKPEPETEAEPQPEPGQDHGDVVHDKPVSDYGDHSDADAPKEVQNDADSDAKPTPRSEPPEVKPESIPELERPADEEAANVPQIKIDEQGSLQMHDGLPEPGPKPEIRMDRQHMILQPPALAGNPMADGIVSEDEERPAGDPPASAMPAPGLLQRGPSTAVASLSPSPAPFAVPPAFTPPQPPPVIPPQPTTPFVATPTAPQPSAGPAPSAFQSVSMMTPSDVRTVSPTLPPVQASPAAVTPPAPVQTLSELERNVNSPHLQQFMPPQPSVRAPAQSAPPVSVSVPAPAPRPSTPQQPVPGVDVTSARDAVMHAYDGTEQNTPIAALNAQPLGAPLHENDTTPKDLQTPPPTPPPFPPPA